MIHYYSSLPPSVMPTASIIEYHARWYGRVLIRLSNWLHDLAYVGARKTISEATVTVTYTVTVEGSDDRSRDNPLT